MSGNLFERELCLLSAKLGSGGPALIVGGGYGLVLREAHLRAAGTRTLLRPYPRTRSTEDIDLFLSAELLLDATRLVEFRTALDDLGYEPVDSALYYQFVRSIDYNGQQRALKIDLLAHVPEGETARAVIRADARRVRNRGVKFLHAHTTPEALTVEEHLLPINVGQGVDQVTVFVPHPFSYLLLKLFALGDQVENAAKDEGRHHAYDLYCILAMTTEEEWTQSQEMASRHAGTDIVQRAGQIVAELFGTASSLGMVRIRDHLRDSGEDVPTSNLERFRTDLLELLGPRRISRIPSGG